MSAARARRRLMAHERYRHRAVQLGADHINARYGMVSHAHSRAWARVDGRINHLRRWPMPHRCPWVLDDRCPYRHQAGSP